MPGGWYDFEASAPYNGADGHRTGIRAYDNAGTILWTEWGDSGFNNTVAQADLPIVNIRSTVEFRRCLCLPVWIEVIQYVTLSTGLTSDLGKATDQTDVEERYAKLIISEACCC